MTYDVHIQIFFANASQPTMITFFVHWSAEPWKELWFSIACVYTRQTSLTPKKKGRTYISTSLILLSFLFCLKKRIFTSTRRGISCPFFCVLNTFIQWIRHIHLFFWGKQKEFNQPNKKAASEFPSRCYTAITARSLGPILQSKRKA